MKSMSTRRKIQYTTQSGLFVLIVLAALVIINGISQKQFARWDLTANKQYTISDATKKMLVKLDDIVNVKLYFSKNLPPILLSKERRVKDLLDEYRAYSKGKIVVKREDPAKDPETENQVRSIGIPQVQMTYRQKDQVEVKNGYFGIAVLYGGKNEVLPIVQDEDNLEYDLTSAIRKVISDTVNKVGFLTGHGEKDVEKEYSYIKGALTQQYEVSTVSLAEKGASIPKDLNALVIAGPKTDFSDKELFEIDQYLMNGGKLIVLMDMVNINFEMGLMASPVQNRLIELLSSYGIILNSDLVLDKYNDRLTYSESPDNRIQYITTVNYPFFIKAMRKNFDQDSPVLRGIETLTLPWTSSIDFVDSKLKDAKITKLIQSSEFAWAQKGSFNLNPKQDFNVPPDQEKQYVLASIVTGEFESYFKGKEIPKAEGDNDAANKGKTVVEKSRKTQIFVVSNSQFITMDSLRRFQNNGVFFLNAVDWLVQGDALIGIRSRSISERPIRELSETSVGILKFVNIFGVSVIMVCVGLIIFYWRKRERKMYESLINR